MSCLTGGGGAASLKQSAGQFDAQIRYNGIAREK